MGQKSEKTDEQRKKSSKTINATKDLSHKTTTTTSSSDKPSPSSSVTIAPLVSKDDFVAKYTQNKLLGRGGFGSVYEGYRKDDNLPVAIKHIPQTHIKRTAMSLNGKHAMVPVEVALLLKVKPAAAETSAVVALLDWCDLPNELILVLERPVPCMDLVKFMVTRGYILQEHEAKVITKQLVDTLIEVHSKGVFHRDIKLDNILIETSSNVPRVWLIDFGSGTVLADGGYTTEEECQNFLLSCLFKKPGSRPSLETLKNHSWLMTL
ncbi:Serine/threonine-protein kinase pim-1 [Channa argus]|uniref:non-specific serine/threonine protein kinase n=1 Tax=Channa argus TaxID=215402 RepID=A0A6G1PMY2_CHAAH|nr:Serine/threonine-protein kinase pim-1 [Channa argus]